MAEGGDIENEEGPGSAYRVFSQMENVLDYLKVIDYERNYCKSYHMKPISRHYFAIATNPGEQFNAFIGLGAWLVRECGFDMDQPQEYDDPNASISTLLQAVRQLNETLNVPPSKLKSGCGESVVQVLLTLCEHALKKRKFEWALPRYGPSGGAGGQDDVVVEDDEDDIEAGNDSDDEDDIEARLNRDMNDDDDEDEGVMLDLDNMSRMNVTKDSGLEPDKESQASKPEGIIESNVNSAEWSLEVERVLPQLKVTIRNESRDWRAHRDQLHQQEAELHQCYSETKPHLERLHEDLSRSLEKIATREKYLNSQLDQSLSNYRVAHEQLAVVRERRKEASGGINDRSRTLVQLSEELDSVKQQMEARGSNMTGDGSWPVARLRQAQQQLKTEMRQMLIRSGLLEHLLLQESLKAKTAAAATGSGPLGSARPTIY